MNIELIKLANDKFLYNKSLSDKELDALINFYSNLDVELTILGDYYYLAWVDIFNKLNRLKGMKEARKSN